MILSHRHRFIFLKTRKTAGTSIELALSQLCGPDDIITPISPADEELRSRQPGPGAQNWILPDMRINRAERFVGKLIGQRARGRGFYNHVPAREVRRIVGEDIWSGYFKFSVERNPWDRQVSLYYWRYRDPRKRPSFRTFMTSVYWRKSVDNFTIYTLDEALAVDFMIRFENLADDLAVALKRVGIADVPPLAMAKSGARGNRRNYRDHYDDETRALVATWYKREIDLFGYTF